MTVPESRSMKVADYALVALEGALKAILSLATAANVQAGGIYALLKAYSIAMEEALAEDPDFPTVILASIQSMAWEEAQRIKRGFERRTRPLAPDDTLHFPPEE